MTLRLRAARSFRGLGLCAVLTGQNHRRFLPAGLGRDQAAGAAAPITTGVHLRATSRCAARPLPIVRSSRGLPGLSLGSAKSEFPWKPNSNSPWLCPPCGIPCRCGTSSQPELGSDLALDRRSYRIRRGSEDTELDGLPAGDSDAHDVRVSPVKGVFLIVDLY